MRQYLHVVVGSYELLVDTSHVLAVLDGEAGRAAGDVRRCDWQERLLPVRDLVPGDRGESCGTGQLIVLGLDKDDRHAFAFFVNAIRGAVELEDSVFMEIPEITETFSHLVDGACIDPTRPADNCLLRLRDPVHSLAPGQEVGA